VHRSTELSRGAAALCGRRWAWTDEGDAVHAWYLGATNAVTGPALIAAALACLEGGAGRRLTATWPT